MCQILFTGEYVVIANNADNGSAIAVFDKTNLYAGGAFTVGVNLSVINVLGASGYNFAPAITYDTNQAAVFILQSANASVGKLALYSITGSAGSAALTSKGNPVGPVWNPGGQLNYGKQLGSSQQINLLDDRIVQPVYREGTLWCAHTILLPSGSPTHSLIQWWQINPTNGNSLQRGYIEDTTAKTNYGFPSIAVNKFKDVFVGFSSFATNQYGSANYAFRACNDPIGSFQAPSLLKAGVSPLWRTDARGRNRWGDYSAAQVDPVNDIDLWTHQEYAGQYFGTLTNGSGRWSTWWGSFIPVLPGNDNFASYYAITNAQGSTNGTTVRATRETGEPSHAGNANTPSVWYRWLVPTSGSTTISATDTGGAFDTVVAVYTGTSVGGLTLVTNRHANGGTNVVFAATAGTTYQIAVAGFNGSCGDFTLNWNAPAAPVILSQPQGTNCVANFNETANFLVSAIGTPNPLYQWRFRGTNNTDTTTNIANATNTSYSIGNVQTNNAGDYSVVVTNSAGSVTSSIATLFIHGNSSARLGPFGFTTNKFWLQIAGLTNRSYVIQSSTNLNSPTNWHNLYTNFVSYWYTNSSMTNDGQRFYRAITNN